MTHRTHRSRHRRRHRRRSRRGGMHTRARRRRTRSAARSYRRHRKVSACHKKGPAVCRSMSNCKWATGPKWRFCRKARNTRRRHRR